MEPAPMIEALTGVKFEKLLEQVPALKNAMGKTEDVKPSRIEKP